MKRYSESDNFIRARGRRRVRIWMILLAFSLALLLIGCGDAEESAAKSTEKAGAKASDSSGGKGGYKVPEFKDAKYHESEASGSGGFTIDTSAASEGYVAVTGESPSRLKFQVIKGNDTYTYDMASDGSPSIFPLQCGNGSYRFQIMENVVDTKYAEAYALTEDVSIKDEFQPFLRPSAYSDYSKDSACVKEAAKISAKAGSQMDVVSGVYDLVCKRVKYDKQKAASVQPGYMPVPDETLKTGKGICFDYASLAAAMLRSQGIPTKVIFGYVAPDDLYHAWNMFYTEETGWVTVSYEVTGKKWNRLDLTFSANGADGKFIGDGSHYSDVYMY